MKHAFLIMAHNEPEVLAALLAQLDDERNDVYLHIDRRAEALRQRFAAYRPRRGGYVLLDRPAAVCWGDVSQVALELRLMRTAAEAGPYAYYHVLSGVDLPIKPQDVIHSFFDARAGREFVGYWNDEAALRQWRDKMRRYYLFTRHLKDKGTPVHRLTAPVRNVVLGLQKAVGFTRRWPLELKRGPNWVSITDACCRYLLEREHMILRTFRRIICPDEIFLQTVVWHSPFCQNLYKPESPSADDANLRHIDWQRGHPYVWTTADMAELAASPCLFARKFSAATFDLNIYAQNLPTWTLNAPHEAQ